MTNAFGQAGVVVKIVFVMIEGFDHLSGSQFSIKNWSHDFNGSDAGMISGRYGGYAFRGTSSYLTNEANFYKSSSFSSITNFSIGIALRLQNFPDGWHDAFGTISDLIQLKTAWNGSVVIRLSVDYSTQLLSIRNSSGTVLATGTTVISNNIWQHFNLIGTVGTSISVAAYLNGALECSATSANIGTNPISGFGMHIYETTGFSSPGRTRSGARTAWPETTSWCSSWPCSR